jgi:hypothetical protein
MNTKQAQAKAKAARQAAKKQDKPGEIAVLAYLHTGNKKTKIYFEANPKITWMSRNDVLCNIATSGWEGREDYVKKLLEMYIPMTSSYETMKAQNHDGLIMNFHNLGGGECSCRQVVITSKENVEMFAETDYVMFM